MQVISGAKVAELGAFLLANVEVGSVIMTDGLAHYKNVCGTDYTHKPFVVSGSGVHAHVALPAVHRMASLLKRWLMSTHQGGVAHHHLQSYLDEFCFRFNRRKSRQRGMLFYRLLEQAVVSAPISQDQLLTRTVTKTTPTIPPVTKRVHAKTLELHVRPKPWRRASALSN